MLSRFSRVRLFATAWAVACQVPLSMDSLCENTGVGCHAFLQGISLTQGSNSHSLNISCIGRHILYHKCHLKSPRYLLCVHMLGHVQLFAISWTVAHQAPLSSTGVGCHFLLQNIHYTVLKCLQLEVHLKLSKLHI